MGIASEFSCFASIDVAGHQHRAEDRDDKERVEARCEVPRQAGTAAQWMLLSLLLRERNVVVVDRAAKRVRSRL